MKQKLRKILPHAAILLCNMYIVFFLIDRVNTAMQFINNSITKALLLILCIISTVNASLLIREDREREAARNRRQGARSAAGPRAARDELPVRAAGEQAARPYAARSATARPAPARSSAAGQRQAVRTAPGRGAPR